MSRTIVLAALALFLLSIPALPLPMPSAAYTLGFSTYLGGSTWEHIRDVYTDPQGNVYVTGGTDSHDFPVTPGAYQTVFNPGVSDGTGNTVDVFVCKFGPSGNLIWSTLLGGPNYDRAYGIKVDFQGNVLLAGRAGAGFPVTAGAFQTTFMGSGFAANTFHPPYGNQDGFVAKLSSDGSRLLWASYFGTADDRIIRDLDVDKNGDIYIASARNSGTYPAGVAGKFLNSPAGGGSDAVFAKIKGDGSAVVWAKYLGGTAGESGTNSVRVDVAGNPHCLFDTGSTGLATPGAYQTTLGGTRDLFVAKLDTATGATIWGTYFGGNGGESLETHEFPGVDAQGNVYIAGPTSSTNLPTSAASFQQAYGGGGNDTFVAKISSDGARVLACTYLGGSSNDRCEGTSLDAAGNVYLTGVTGSPNFPITADAFQKTLGGSPTSFAVVVASDLSHLLFSSYIGGSAANYGRGGHVDANGNFYFGGETSSADFPIVNAYQPVMRGSSDAFVAKLSKATQSVTPPSIVAQPANQTVTAGQTATFSVTATGTAPLSYQWQRNGIVVGSNSSSYTTPATTLADNGVAFRVVVSNSAGSVTSNSATLTVSSVPVGSGTGLTGEYFDNMDFTALKVTRIDATVDFNWSLGSPDSSIGVDTFSARWTGFVEAQYSQTYTFYTVSDDGVRLWVNGQLLVNNWTNHAATENSASIALVAGQKVPIRMEYYENGGYAVARLLWSSASTPKEAVPKTQLYPAAPPWSVTLEAEAMATKTTGGAVTGGWGLYSNGYVEDPVMFPASQSYRFDVVAYGTPGGDAWPIAEVRIDGVAIGQVRVTSPAPTWATYSVTGTVSAGSHRVALAFTNDYYAPPADRNLFLDKVTIR